MDIVLWPLGATPMLDHLQSYRVRLRRPERAQAYDVWRVSSINRHAVLFETALKSASGEHIQPAKLPGRSPARDALAPRTIVNGLRPRNTSAHFDRQSSARQRPAESTHREDGRLGSRIAPALGDGQAVAAWKVPPSRRHGRAIRRDCSPTAAPHASPGPFCGPPHVTVAVAARISGQRSSPAAMKPGMSCCQRSWISSLKLR